MAAPIAPRLFGRAREQAALRSAFEAAETGKTVFLLIEGPAGIGKSALVADFRETLPNETLLAAGRYEEPEHIPFSGLREALSGAARHLLAQDSSAVAVWRQRLQDALRPNGRVVSDLVPEFEQLLGPQEALRELEPAEQRARAFTRRSARCWPLWPARERLSSCSSMTYSGAGSPRLTCCRTWCSRVRDRRCSSLGQRAPGKPARMARWKKRWTESPVRASSCAVSRWRR